MELMQSAVSVMEFHGVWFLICIALWPRITMLVTGICAAIGGPLFWLGFVLFPHITVAILATSIYWNTNPVLCCIAWWVAFAGTVGELQVSKQVKDQL